MMLWAVKYFWAPKMRALCGRMPLGLGLPPRMSRGHADGVMVLAASVFNSSCSLSSNPNFLHYILTSYSLSPITFCLKQHLHCCTRINTWNNVQAHRSRNITHMNVLHQYQNRLQYHVSKSICNHHNQIQACYHKRVNQYMHITLQWEFEYKPFFSTHDFTL